MIEKIKKWYKSLNTVPVYIGGMIPAETGKPETGATIALITEDRSETIELGKSDENGEYHGEGKLIYSHRMSVVEPMFGNIENNKGLDRFSLRGKKKVQGQWQLYCIIHNIEKLKNYGKLAA